MSQARPALASPWFRAALLVALAYWILDLWVLRSGVPHPLDDTWEDGLIARGLLHAEWFRTRMLYPPLWALRDPHTTTLPVMIHGPLLPLLWVPSLRAFGSAALDQSAWLAAGFAILVVPFLFRFTARWLGEPVAGAAALLWTLSPLTLYAVHHYASVVLGAWLLIASLDALAREPARCGRAGVLFGLAYLVRPELLLGVPVLLGLAGRGARRGGRGALLWLSGFVIVACSWWWHQARATGTPGFNLSSYLLVCFSPAHPGDALIRDFHAMPDRWPSLLRESWPALWPKWRSFSLHAAKNALFAPTGTTGWLWPIGLAWAMRRAPRRRWVVASVLLSAIPLATMTLLVHIRHYLVPFLPLYAIAAALGARTVAGWFGQVERPMVWTLGLVVLALPSSVLALREAAADAPRARALLSDERSALESASAFSHPELAGRLMISDRPDFVAWTTGRPTLWLQRDEYARLPAAADSADPVALPRRPGPADTWFHEGHWGRGARAATL